MRSSNEAFYVHLLPFVVNLSILPHRDFVSNIQFLYLFLCWRYCAGDWRLQKMRIIIFKQPKSLFRVTDVYSFQPINQIGSSCISPCEGKERWTFLHVTDQTPDSWAKVPQFLNGNNQGLWKKENPGLDTIDITTSYLFLYLACCCNAVTACLTFTQYFL